MKTNNKLFLVEGLDLAGKTSACNKLVALMSPRPEHSRNALSGKNTLYDAADDLRKTDGIDGTYLGHAYLAAAAFDVRLFQPPRQCRIQESTIALRSYAHYKARGEDVLADGFAHILDDPQYPRFDAAVVLTASLEERRNRLEKRRMEAPDEIAPDDLAVVATPDLFIRMEEILVEEAKHRFGAVILDTTGHGLGEDEVVTTVARILGFTLS
jgi:hypothetical protein